jgi:TRAP transporter TAXI family solute receptor
MSQAKQFSKSVLNYFVNLDPLAKLIFLLLGGASLGLLIGLILGTINGTKTYRLKLAAGDQLGESYILSEAIEKTVEARHPKIQIELVKTGGTSENLEKLEKGEVDLATAQADVPPGASARTVAVLYRDLFQLVVKENSGINQFTDLRGKPIGLQQSGGQFRSFLDVAAHYGLQPTDFLFVGNSDQEADEAFRENRVQAVFRVRAPGNQSVADLVQKYRGQLAAIEQANAMRIKYPAFQADQIPQGAYQGNPPVPAVDLNTVGVERLLLANHTVPDTVIRDITAVINEHRQALTNQIQVESVKPLVSSIRDPRQSGEVDVPIHQGALNYYERNEPSFVQENADFLALLLTVALLGGSWLWELKNWIERRKKDFADRYIEKAVHLMKEGDDPVIRQRSLDQIFREAATNLVEEKISQESFRTFNEAYKTAREAIDREKQIALQAQREVSADYIKALMRLMQDQQRGKQLVQRDLDQILEKASTDLVNDTMSQESFRTFVEAYKTTRDVVERRTA